MPIRTEDIIGDRLLSNLYETEIKLEVKEEDKPWKPQPWQYRAYNDRQSEVLLLTGSAGGGKSALLCAKAHRICQAYPGAFVLAVRKTRESMTASTALFLEDQIIKTSAKHNKSQSEFTYPNGSILKYAGMNGPKERERIRSIGRTGGVDFIFCDEANQLTEADYEELTARLRGTATGWKQIMLGTNPDDPNHWINKRLIRKGEATVVKSTAYMNKYVDDQYRRMLERLTGLRYERLVLGNWVSAEGLVYDNWDDSVNLIDSFKIPKEWKRIGSIDFGFQNPTVAQWWAVDNDNKMHMYREIYQTGLLAGDLAAMIQEYSKDEDVLWVADHAAAERATLRRRGVATKTASKKVNDGINVVNDRLRPQGDTPGIMLCRDSLVATDKELEKSYLPTCTAEEITGYVWDRKEDGSITDKPLKQNDHGCDALRYAAVEVFKPRMKLIG